MKQDSLTSAEVSLTGDHGYIHDGFAFSVPMTVSALVAAGVSNIGFTTPSATAGNPQIHWRPIEFSSSANSCRVRLFQGSAATATDVDLNLFYYEEYY